MMQPRAPGASRLMTVLLLTALLAACGGGGSGGNDAAGNDNGGDTGGGGDAADDGGDDGGGDPPATLPILSIADAAVTEGDTGTVTLTFALSLSEAAADDITVDYQTQDGSAAAGDDYTAAGGMLTIPAGDTAAGIDVAVLGDTVDESDETFTIELLNPSANVLLGTAAATGTITDDDQPPPVASTAGMNDTGTTRCSTVTANDLACNDTASGTDLYPGQDAERGRDATDGDDGDGAAGFAFLKLDADGDPLSDQSADYAAAPWSCVQDLVTGLVWEIKTQDGGLHDAGWTYSWYRSSGEPLGASNGGDCDDAASCDTEKFVAAVNAAGFCGADDWRLATTKELLSLVHFGAGGAPFIDAGYFPNTAALGHWTGTVGPTGLRPGYVSFAPPRTDFTDPQQALAVRLVREAD